MSLTLTCPTCKSVLSQSSQKLECLECHQTYPIIDGIPSFVKVKDNFYDTLYQTELGAKWAEGFLKFKNPLLNIISGIRSQISIIGRRHRFFKQVFGNDRGKLILDLGCGGGYELFTNYGDVVGIDLELTPLKTARSIYPTVVHGDVMSLPFEGNTFDYVVSADLIGHIPIESKDRLFSEVYRVLKKAGKTAHIIETDSTNYLYRFAHRYPDLFKRAFIEEIGGHFGLEMPSAVLKRFDKHEFKLIRAEKIWGPIWPIEEYVQRFNNEYKKKSILIGLIVAIAKILNGNIILREITNVFMGILNYVIEAFKPLDHGQGLLVLYKK